MLTDFNDLTIAVSERAFNTIIKSFRRQAPALFNYATADLIASIHEAASAHPEKLKNLLCDVQPVEENAKRKHPQPVAALFTPVPYLPILGYSGDRGLSYVLQISEITFDFHPNNTIALPTELAAGFEEQTVGLKLTLCAGLACPDKKKLDTLLDQLPPPQPFDPAKAVKFKLPEPPTNTPTKPFDTDHVDCFCLDVIALARIKRRPQLIDPDENLEYLSIELTAVEIVDVRPAGLENTLECLIYLTLNFGLLPQLRMLVKDLMLAAGPFAVRMTPLSAKIPFNPSVAKDELRAFLSITVS